MAKELRNKNAPPDVFQMFNENRTYYFESDISSLPHLPCTLPEPVTRYSLPKLQKSFSQPHLNVTSSASTGLSASTQPAGNLHLPTAIMAPTTFQAPSHTHPNREGGGGGNSLESRYQTEPSYSSSRILKSFHQEFNLFGHSNKGKSVSAPSSPRRASSPELELPPVREMQISESRKLSLVKEETEREVKTETRTVLVAEHSTEIKEVKSQNNPSKMLASVPTDSVDGELLQEVNKSRSLTKQMMKWFVTPQKQTETSRTEFNAVTPSSF